MLQPVILWSLPAKADKVTGLHSRIQALMLDCKYKDKECLTNLTIDQFTPELLSGDLLELQGQHRRFWRPAAGKSKTQLCMSVKRQDLK